MTAATKLEDKWSLEEKLWKKTRYIKKQKHHFVNKGLSSQTCGFLVFMYECEIWTIKNAECWRIDYFKLWCYRRLLRVPWTARRSNQSVLKEINPEYSLKGLMLNLKLQYFGHLMWRIWKWPWWSGQEEKGVTMDEMVMWHHWLHGMNLNNPRR